MSDKPRLPAPVTTTEEYLNAIVVELRVLGDALMQLAQSVAEPAVVDLSALPETIELIEGEEQPRLEGNRPKKGRKKVAE